MRLNTAVVIAALTLLVGLIFGQNHLWVPGSVLTAGLLDLQTRGGSGWNRVGSSAGFSIGLKLICSLIGFYAALGQIACLALLVWWIAV